MNSILRATTFTVKVCCIASILPVYLTYKVASSLLPLMETEDCDAEFEKEDGPFITDEDVFRRSSSSSTPSPAPLSPPTTALKFPLPSPPTSPLSPPGTPSLSWSTSSCSSVDDTDDEGYSSGPSPVDNLESALDAAAAALALAPDSGHPTAGLQAEIPTIELDIDIEYAQRDVDQFPRSTLRAGVVRAWRQYHLLPSPPPLLKSAIFNAQVRRESAELEQQHDETEQYWVECAEDPEWAAANVEDADLYARNMEEYWRWQAWKTLEPEERHRQRHEAEWRREQASQQAEREAARLASDEEC
ncbi:hypothetical protein RQP46_002083 [Phenoliferia psychrophenolica]